MDTFCIEMWLNNHLSCYIGVTQGVFRERAASPTRSDGSSKTKTDGRLCEPRITSS